MDFDLGGMKGLAVTQLLRAKYSSSPLSFPVARSQYIYANFKNISGVPVSGEGRGIPLSKLRAIDSMIERLKNKTIYTSSSQLADLNDNELSIVISRMSEKIHNSVKKEMKAGNSSGNKYSAFVLNYLA